MNWKEYQIKVSSIFESIGATTTIEKKVKGARGLHEIDVFVELEKYGIPMTWICECKYWNSAIPKEKVLALYEITKDVGADKAFLFSESGFQSGAKKVATKTNIVLSSIDEICTIIGTDLRETKLTFYLKEFARIKSSIKTSWIDDTYNFSPLPNIEIDEAILYDGILMLLSAKIQKAINGNLPVTLKGINSQSQKCKTIEEVLSTLSKIHSEIRNVEFEFVNSIEKEKEKIKMLRDDFCKDSLSLIDSVNIQIEGKAEDFEAQILETLKHLKSIGNLADKLKIVSRGTMKIQFTKSMNSLIKNIYPHMTENNVNDIEWNLKISNTINELNKLEKITDF